MTDVIEGSDLQNEFIRQFVHEIATLNEALAEVMLSIAKAELIPPGRQGTLCRLHDYDAGQNEVLDAA